MFPPRVRAYAPFNPMADRIDVHVYAGDRGQTMYYRWDGKEWVTEPIAEGARPPENPSIVLPMQMAKAVTDAIMDELPPDRSMGSHLKDAVQVRDRLLSLIEQRGLR